MSTSAKKITEPELSQMLEKRARDLLEADDATRKNFIREDFWLEYDAAEVILEDYQELVEAPMVHRPECRLLIGPACNGKTELLLQCAARNPYYEREDKQGIVAPVIYIQAPRKPDEMAFFSGILRSVNSPFNPSDRIDRRINQVLTVLKAVDCRVLLIDEIHNILTGSDTQNRHFQDTLRFLTNEAQISLVMAGVRKALTTVENDQQLVTRVAKHYLPRWENDSSFQRLIAGLEVNLPLRSFSWVAESSEMLAEIFRRSGGLLGVAKKILGKAAIKAIENGTERITLNLIKHLRIDTIGEKPDVPKGLD